MKVLILLTVLIALTSATSLLNKCNGKTVEINGKKYKQGVLKEGKVYHGFIYDYNTKYVFYTKIEGDVFIPSYINIETNECGTIGGIVGAYVYAYDKDTDILYIGGPGGIYIFNYDTKKAENTELTDKTVIQIFAKTTIYITTSDGNVCAFKDGSLITIQATIGVANILGICVDLGGNTYYYNSSGLFCNKKDTEVTIRLLDILVIGVAADIDGILYIVTGSGIYTANDCEVKKISNVLDLLGILTIDDICVSANVTGLIILKLALGSGSGTLLGSGTGTQPGVGTGTLPGSGTGTLPGSGTGTLPGSGTGTQPGSGTGTQPGSDTVSKCASLPGSLLDLNLKLL